MARNKHLKNRTIHLVDIENVCGTARPEILDVEMARELYQNLVCLGPYDHVVLACNHGAALKVGLGWPGARLMVRSGVNGADRALLSVVDDEEIGVRFDAVVIASGDGIFAESAACLAGSGLSVTVVSREQALSRRLQLAASCVRTFNLLEFDQDAA